LDAPANKYRSKGWTSLKKVLSIQNVACETLGTLESLFRADGFEVETISAQEGVPASLAGYSAIVILGGPMAVYDDLPYLQKEQDLIRDAIRNDVPVLGICLGSQLVAQAAGGRVYKGRRKEIGWSTVSLTPEGQRGIFGTEEREMRVFQWHGDTYDLPPGAKVLAYSDLYPQAFKIGSAIGLQFHLEVDEGMIRTWMDEYKAEVSAEKLRAQDILPAKGDVENLAKRCQLVYRNFASIVRCCTYTDG
jgi:GMP synthase (glutamine-hydrolysing)